MIWFLSHNLWLYSEARPFALIWSVDQLLGVSGCRFEENLIISSDSQACFLCAQSQATGFSLRQCVGKGDGIALFRNEYPPTHTPLCTQPIRKYLPAATSDFNAPPEKLGYKTAWTRRSSVGRTSHDVRPTLERRVGTDCKPICPSIHTSRCIIKRRTRLWEFGVVNLRLWAQWAVPFVQRSPHSMPVFILEGIVKPGHFFHVAC